MKKNKIFAIFMVALLPACLPIAVLDGVQARQEDELARIMRNRMIGQTSPQVFSCLGIPNRTATSGDTQYFVYNNSGKGADAGFGGERLTCEATFEINQERVSGLRLVGTMAGQQTENIRQCAVLLKPCFPDLSLPALVR